jgi:hypothetical protein
VAVHDEGHGVLSLYVSAAHVARLFRALEPLAEGGLLAALDDAGAVPGSVPMDGGGWIASGRILRRYAGSAGEYIVVDDSVLPSELMDALPGSLLSAPGHSLPEGLGARVALTLSDDGHAVVLGRSPKVLASFLPPQARLLTDAELAHVMRPVANGSWHELHDDGDVRTVAPTPPPVTH